MFSSAASTAAKISVLTDWQCLINWSRCILHVLRFTQTAKKEKLIDNSHRTWPVRCGEFYAVARYGAMFCVGIAGASGAWFHMWFIDHSPP